MRTESECEAVSVSAHVFSSSRSFWAATDDSVQDWRSVFSKNKGQVMLLSLSSALGPSERAAALCVCLTKGGAELHTHTLYLSVSPNELQQRVQL